MIEEYFDTVSGEDDWTPRYNIAPTQLVPVIRQNPGPSPGIIPAQVGDFVPGPRQDMATWARPNRSRRYEPATYDPSPASACLSFYKQQVYVEGEAEQPSAHRLSLAFSDASTRMTPRLPS